MAAKPEENSPHTERRRMVDENGNAIRDKNTEPCLSAQGQNMENNKQQIEFHQGRGPSAHRNIAQPFRDAQIEFYVKSFEAMWRCLRTLAASVQGVYANTHTHTRNLYKLFGDRPAFWSMVFGITIGIVIIQFA